MAKIFSNTQNSSTFFVVNYVLDYRRKTGRTFMNSKIFPQRLTIVSTVVSIPSALAESTPFSI